MRTVAFTVYFSPTAVRLSPSFWVGRLAGDRSAGFTFRPAEHDGRVRVLRYYGEGQAHTHTNALHDGLDGAWVLVFREEVDGIVREAEDNGHNKNPKPSAEADIDVEVDAHA